MVRFTITLLCLLAIVPSADAQDALRSRPDVQQALAFLEKNHDAHVQKQIAIAEIPAPGFHEEKRAAFMMAEFKRVGLADIEIDPIGNVLGWRPGRTPKTLVVAAHLDTVFPAGTDVKVRRQGTRLLGPGLADDSRGLAGLLALVEALNTARIQTERTLLFVADVGEEGLGNTRGVKYLFQEGRHRARLDSFITIDGFDFATISTGAVGSRRYRVTIKGPGGHSYADFGLVNPAHALGRIIARFADIQVPDSPKTTYNVGLIGGGTSVNSIPFENWMEVDMRSESKAELARLEAGLMDAIRRGIDQENQLRAKSGSRLEVETKLVGDRPVGQTSPDAPLVQAAQWATRAMGAEPRLDYGSTDAGAPTSMGIPAIALSWGGLAGGVHSLGEWFDPTGAYKGLQRVLLTILAFDQMPSGAVIPKK